jgi:hypothetical protein
MARRQDRNDTTWQRDAPLAPAGAGRANAPAGVKCYSSRHSRDGAPPPAPAPLTGGYGRCGIYLLRLRRCWSGRSASSAARAAEDCPYRSELDETYCDANRDLVADPPKDPKRLRNASTLVFASTPIEDPAVYQNLFKGCVDQLAACPGKKVVYFAVQSNAAQIEAMRAGRLHIAGFSSGQTGFAGNLAGVVPSAMKADDARILFKNDSFPTSSFAYAHDLDPCSPSASGRAFSTIASVPR